MSMISQNLHPSNNFSHTPTTLDFTESGKKIISHIWYKLLNINATGGLFLTTELAERGNCSGRTVYSFLKDCVSKGFLSVQNKGRNGLLISVLKKGWKLTLMFMKTAFLAYFRDLGRIPYIYTPNTYPQGGGFNKQPNRIDKICKKEGLTEAQTRTIKEKISLVDKVKNIGGLVKYFINQIKDGILKPTFTGEEIAHRELQLNELKNKANLDARTQLELDGIREPKPKGVIMTIQELDDYYLYCTRLSTLEVTLFNQLCLEHGLSKKDI